MKPGEYPGFVHHERFVLASRWIDRPVTDTMRDQLAVYQRWLSDEAETAGGIGPGESRIHERHVIDSLLFAYGWRGRDPGEVLDIGTGVGLPAVPLAITHPGSLVIALDRSGRRIRLLKRALRILGLENVEPVQGDLAEVRGRYPAVVSRAAIPPLELRPRLEQTTTPDGVAVLGGSHVARPELPGYRTVEIPSEILDRPAWILIMAQS